ncbi:MAG: AbgT family transporter [Deltaproteobacteria bacterium]|nr:AbgT family transporter [Deltaproteobacteria bacterium]
MSGPAGGARRSTRLLDAIERIGNRLPAPATLFLIGAVLVMILSQVAASLDWTVEKARRSPARSSTPQPARRSANSPWYGFAQSVCSRPRASTGHSAAW